MVLDTSGTTAKLDLEKRHLDGEAALLLDPDRFAGLDADNEAAGENLRHTVAGAFDAWLRSRRAFFAKAVEACGQRVAHAGSERPSLYLTNLRDDELNLLAEQYVDRYGELLETLVEQVRPGAKRALVEPVLLFDRGAEGPNFFSIAPSHPMAVAFLATVQQGLLGRSWSDREDRRALKELFDRPLLSGVLPWLPWRGDVLTCARSGPLLWRLYGTPGGGYGRH